jgi:hypothetical protein
MSWREAPTHGTWSWWWQRKAQKAEAGRLAATWQKRRTSARSRNMTKPR